MPYKQTPSTSVFREPSSYKIYTVDLAGNKTVIKTVTSYEDVKSYLVAHAEKYPQRNSPIVEHIYDPTEEETCSGITENVTLDMSVFNKIFSN